MHILTAGTHTDSEGDSESFSLSDLDELVESYNPDRFEAPIVLGHEEDLKALIKNDRAPAYGWSKKLVKEGNDLFAYCDVLPELDEWLRREPPPFKYRSAALYEKNSPYNPTPGKLYLRHIGILGAQPPAIKGLEKIIRFKQGADTVMVYTKEMLSKDLEALSKAGLLNDLESPDSELTALAEDDVEDETPEVKVPDENSSQEEIVDFLNGQTTQFLSYVLSIGANGYLGEITGFEPEPSQENNWLYDVEKEQFSGVFYDLTSPYNDGFNFIIKKDGDGWTKSYQVNGAKVDDEVSAMGEFGPITEDEELELSTLEKAQTVVSPITPDGIIPNDGKSPLLQAQKYSQELSKGINPPVAESSPDLLSLRAEIERLRDDLRTMKEKELASFAESFYSDGKLTAAQIDKKALIQFLSFIEGAGNGPGLKSFSEKANGLDPLSWFKDFMTKSLKPVISFGEFDPYKANDVLANEQTYSDDPIINMSGIMTHSDEGQMDLHKKVIGFCMKKGLNPKNSYDYIQALKSVQAGV